MTQPPEIPAEDAARIKAELHAITEESIRRRLALLRSAVPEIVADAERFVSLSNDLPWEFGIALAEGEIRAYMDKYDVQCGRHRPPSDSVSPATDLFCEAAVLLTLVETKAWEQDFEAECIG